jgi:site-specific DNA recombinase
MSRSQPSTMAVTYSRNSSAKQKSITDQREVMSGTCAENRWQIVAELDDPSSASRYARKVRENWTALLDLVPTVNVVVLWEPSRGDRTLSSWATFLDLCRDHSVQIHAVSHQRTYDPRNPRDYRSLAEDGVDAAYESDKTSQRVRRGKRASAAQGKPNGVVTYGFSRRYDTTTTPPTYIDQIPHPGHAAVVRDIITSIAGGETVSSVSLRLNHAQVPTARGSAVWYASTIKNIAINPTYRPHPDDLGRACRMDQGVAYPATWPPLVDEATWQACQHALATGDHRELARRRASPPGRVKYLLSGSIRVMTAPCGGKLQGYPLRPGRSAYYICEADQCTSAGQVEADEYVTQLIVARLSKRDARHLWAADTGDARKAAAELARLRADLAANETAYENDEISAKLAGARERKLGLEIADAERRAQPAGAPLAALKLLAAAKLGRDRVRPTWDSFPLLSKREVIAGIFDALVLGPVTTRITQWTSPEERLDIVSERITHEWRTP